MVRLGIGLALTALWRRDGVLSRGRVLLRRIGRHESELLDGRLLFLARWRHGDEYSD